MTILEQVKQVAVFADHDSPQVYWSHVAFHKGELWAQGVAGGALVKTPELDIDIAVPAKKLLKALQAVGEDPKLSVEERRLKISGDGTTARLEGVRVKDMPPLHRPGEGATWHQVSFERAGAFDWCVSKDVTRRHLSGFHVSEAGRLECTDGHALVTYDLGAKLPEVLVRPALLTGLTGAQWVSKFDGRVFVAPERGGVSGFRVGSLIDAVFPPTDQILHGLGRQGSIRVNREALVALLKRAKLSSVEVCLEVKDGRLGVEVDGDRQQSLFGFASSVPFTPGTTPPKEGKIGFSLEVLLPLVASATSEEVTIHLSPSESGGLDPLMVTDGPYTGVGMPYRLT